MNSDETTGEGTFERIAPISTMMPQPVVLLSRKIRLLQKFTAEWAGEVVDEEALVRILNPNGTRPPLIWCFNGAHEFPALAEAMGPDQPVIGLRSLNTVVNFSRKHLGEDIEIARYYAEVLWRHFDHDIVWIGGNCQGAAVAAELANAFVQAGRSVAGLFVMEWSSLLPWPGACHFLFGEESHDFNPFLKHENPWPLWRQMYKSVTCSLLPGSHGQFFGPEKMGRLASILQSTIAAGGQKHCTNNPSVTSPLASIQLPKAMAENSKIKLLFQADEYFDNAQTVCAIWLPHSFGQSHSHTLFPLSRQGNGVSFVFNSPEAAGEWTLKMMGCNDKDGPVLWHQEFPLAWRLSVLPV